MTIFMTSRHTGRHWDSLQKAKGIIEKLSLDIKGYDERKFEDRISGALQPNFNHFIDQRNLKQVMTRVPIFDHDHRPDMSIGTDGIAIEVKSIKSGASFREAIGQSMIYRIGYRFVIVVWVDSTRHKTYKQLCDDPESIESQFIKEMEDYNIFCVVK
ncbi:MAG: hypothetical protein JXR46_04080 [Calditrichaceae bacterium]|nr:hypothetical protein [Calditrichaceae bacterium]MBN2708205.1 hypothetical protein [Calditrichaceae bacterium]RQV97397.1 MAG: hypothetical protein EH224_01610 [Calditrichota bacterium]